MSYEKKQLLEKRTVRNKTLTAEMTLNANYLSRLNIVSDKNNSKKTC